MNWVLRSNVRRGWYFAGTKLDSQGQPYESCTPNLSDAVHYATEADATAARAAMQYPDQYIVTEL